MKVLNKVLTVLLAIALLVPVFAATAEEEMPVITMLVSLDAANPPEDAPIVQAIREASGVDLQPIYVPITEAATKLSARIASGDLPDIFATDTVVATELIGYGALLDMAPYLEEYGQNILADGTARLEFGVNTNGAVYALPRSMSYPWCMSVRRDWMRNLGYEVGDESVIEMPIDEFKQLMYDFTHGDPDQDGKDDTFGFCAEDSSVGMFAPIFTAYGIPVQNWGSMYYDEEAGVCKSIIKHPRFQEALELMQYFYQNGCMDTEFAVVADASTEFAYLWNSTAGAAAWSPAGMTNNWVSRYTEEGVDENSFVYVNITDNNGANGGFIVNYSGWVCVSAACKNPEAAIKLIDFMYSKDGGTMTYLGIEGMHYQWIDQENEKFEYIGKYTDIANQRTDGGWILWNIVHADDNFELRTLTPITVDVINYAKEHQMANAAVIYSTPAIANELGSTLTDVVMKLFANATVAEGDITDLYNQYVAEYDSIGGLTYEEQFTELYKAEKGL